jgi:D-alanyl-D-alanine carboxypeptidase
MLSRMTGGFLALSLLALSPAPPSWLPTAGIPGMELVIVSHGRITTDAAYGVRNLDTQQPVDAHTRFEIGSITKQFTAAAILQLKERGKLSLGDRLGKYVPQYAIGRNITLRQLLLQISGIPNYTDTKQFRALITLRGTSVVVKHSGSFDAMLAFIQNLPLHFKPGSRFQYSNSNYLLLGRVVEIVSGMPYERYVAKNIFARAGMRDSSFMEDEPRISDIATGYTMYRGHVRPAGPATGWADGAGAIVSTATDLAKWDEALFSGKIISMADVRLMTTPSALPAFGPTSHYAFGWVVDRHDGEPRIWHNGGTLGFSASNEIYPGLDEVVIALINTTVTTSDVVANAAFAHVNPQLAARANASVAGEDPAITARAKEIFAQLVGGSLDRTQFTPQMNAALSPAMVAGVRQQLQTLGPAKAWIFRGKTVAGAQTTYAYRVTFGSGTTLTVYMSIQPDGKISGYLVSPN